MKYFTKKSSLLLVLSLPILVSGIYLLRNSIIVEHVQLLTFYPGLVFFLLGISFILLFLINNYLLPKNRVYRIVRVFFHNYETLIVKRNNDAFFILLKIFCAFFSFVLIFASFNAWLLESENLDSYNTETLKITLNETPKVYGKHHDISSLITNEYPSFEFSFDNYYEKKLYRADFVNKVKLGDTLNIIIRGYDYKTKISKETPTNFVDKHFEWKSINVYGVKSSKECFYDLNCYNEYKKDNEDLSSWYFIIGVLFLIFIFIRLE